VLEQFLLRHQALCMLYEVDQALVGLELEVDGPPTRYTAQHSVSRTYLPKAQRMVSLSSVSPNAFGGLHVLNTQRHDDTMVVVTSFFPCSLGL